MEYKCSACNKEVDGDLLVYVDHTERHIIDEIKISHPEWVENDGPCQKCVDYFKGQMKGNS